MGQSFRIVMISDMDSTGSGYASITTALGSRLADLGHAVKIIGLSYNGEEHRYNFSLYPCLGINDAFAMLQNMKILFNPDVVIGLADIPNQEPIISMAKKLQIPYICITPMENGPLCATWATYLSGADKCYVMSEFAVKECEKMGVKAEHLTIGIDTESWKPPTTEERQKLRESYGLGDEFVILTVADNQERKNLWGALSAIGMFKKNYNKPFKYWLVTRENQYVGYRLRDLAMVEGMLKELTIFERGMPFKMLWGLYACADAFLLTSKAEGLGMPVLEAMSVGVPIVATKTGALIEHLQEHRGDLVYAEYTFIDTWGNSRRDMIGRTQCASALMDIARGDLPNIKEARKYVTNRNWDSSVKQLLEGIENVTHKQ
jgi:glycosyltransferase involved in cell wall biosynthesis